VEELSAGAGCDDAPHSWRVGCPADRDIEAKKFSDPLLAVIDREPVPFSELVEAGRKLAAVLVTHRLPVILNSDGPWSGVWDLEKLTDSEAVAWGTWVAKKARQ
jgi:hypothetical protein